MAGSLGPIFGFLILEKTIRISFAYQPITGLTLEIRLCFNKFMLLDGDNDDDHDDEVDDEVKVDENFIGNLLLATSNRD